MLHEPCALLIHKHNFNQACIYLAHWQRGRLVNSGNVSWFEDVGQVFSETLTFGSVSSKTRRGIISQEESYASSECTHLWSAPPCINNQSQTHKSSAQIRFPKQQLHAKSRMFLTSRHAAGVYSCHETHNSNLAETKVTLFHFLPCVIFGGDNPTIMLSSHQQNKSPRNLCIS